MNRFYEPDLTSNPDSPFIRDANGKLVRRSYWMDMDDRTFFRDLTSGQACHSLLRAPAARRVAWQ
jgi:hypothetical protein